MPRPNCLMDGCEKESRGRGLCATHWKRWRTHGDPSIVKMPGRDYNLKSICTVEDCPSFVKAHGLCVKHVQRFKKYGDTETLGPMGRPLTGGLPRWQTVHKRLGRERGSARTHICVDCGKRAQEWSYNHLDPAELIGDRMRYSLDLSYYEPRCIKCHRGFDAAERRTKRLTPTGATDD